VIWLVCGILSLAIPSGKIDGRKDYYYSTTGRYVEYENQQRQYENQQNQQNNNGNNNYYSVYPTCKWYQVKCRNSQYYYRAQNGNGDKNDMVYTPDWYRFIGGGQNSEEDRRFYEEMGINYNADEPSGAMKFVHAWTIVMFVGLLAYGAFVLLTGRSLLGLIVLCAVFAQFSLLQIVLCGQGVISSDNRQIEDTIYGWWGQAGVAQVYLDFGVFLFCTVFGVIFSIQGILRICMSRRAATSSKLEDEVDHEQGLSSPPAVYRNLD
jgi:hypothetical protein